MQDVVRRDGLRFAEALREIPGISRQRSNRILHGVEGRHAHFDWVGERPAGLIFQRARAAIPEQAGQKSRIQESRRVPVAAKAVDPG
ncbi:MAG: hypothetical protein R3D43_12665 [Tepidamorphaceae bacterium]